MINLSLIYNYSAFWKCDGSQNTQTVQVLLIISMWQYSSYPAGGINYLINQFPYNEGWGVTDHFLGLLRCFVCSTLIRIGVPCLVMPCCLLHAVHLFVLSALQCFALLSLALACLAFSIVGLPCAALRSCALHRCALCCNAWICIICHCVALDSIALHCMAPYGLVLRCNYVTVFPCWAFFAALLLLL